MTAALDSDLRAVLNRCTPATPCLVMDLDAVRRRYHELRAALPDVALHYAVKANPARKILEFLVAQGSSFDAASVAEIELCLHSGAAPERISYGNTIKKARDIAHAYRLGVRTFVTDSEPDLRAIADNAPGAAVLVRIMAHGRGSTLPFGPKFGCHPAAAVNLLRLAATSDLVPLGIAFHPGSQQLDVHAWDSSIATAAGIGETLRDDGIVLSTLDIGGGFPATYRDTTPSLSDYGTAITRAIATHFSTPPALMAEPGRALVAEAGVIRSEVVLVATRGDGRRWVYLDVGRYSGLAETEGEAIAYQLRTDRDGPDGPVAIAGPTCDNDDVLYQHTAYRLPLSLTAGDHVDLLAAGAYTASYSSVEFNGFAPLPTHCIATDWKDQ